MTSIIASRLSSVPRLGSSLVLQNVSRSSPLEQVRFAGHAKWQNIRNTKQAGDLAKCRLISRYVQLVKRAIIANGMKTDPKLNGQLASVLTEAAKFNVPKATLERAITRATNMELRPHNLEIEGPGKSTIIARCETETYSVLRRDVKKALRKLDANLLPDDTLINMFRSRGFVRTALVTKDGREVTQDFAEEAAIMANAEEVYMEELEEAEDPNLRQVWVFTTDAKTLNSCKGDLEKQGLNVASYDSELVPYNYIDFGPGVYERVVEVCEALRELDQVVDVFHNALPSSEDRMADSK